MWQLYNLQTMVYKFINPDVLTSYLIYLSGYWGSETWLNANRVFPRARILYPRMLLHQGPMGGMDLQQAGSTSLPPGMPSSQYGDHSHMQMAGDRRGSRKQTEVRAGSKQAQMEGEAGVSTWEVRHWIHKILGKQKFRELGSCSGSMGCIEHVLFREAN